MSAAVRRTAIGCAAALALALTVVASIGLTESPSVTSAGPAPAPEPTAWTASWGSALTEARPGTPSADGFADTTLRQVVHLSLGGDTLRVRLSNAHGTAPLPIGAVTVAPGSPGSPDVSTSTLRGVTFDGEPSVAVPAGEDVASDPVRLAVADDSDLVVSVHVAAAPGPATWLASAFATSWAAPGEATRDDGGAFAAMDSARYLVAGVDVPAAESRGSVVFLGDSITAGAGSSVDGDLRYPDRVAERLLQATGRRCGVVNAGIGGNRLLTDGGAAGRAVTARFADDVAAVPGVRTVVVLAGVNDLGASGGRVGLADLVRGHRDVVRQAEAAGIRAVGATVLPYGGAGYASDRGERTRRALNRWIRTSGTYDAVVDLDRAVRDPGRPDRLRAAYDSGDHLHPGDAGYARMAEAVDLTAVC